MKINGHEVGDGMSFEYIDHGVLDGKDVEFYIIGSRDGADIRITGMGYGEKCWDEVNVQVEKR